MPNDNPSSGVLRSVKVGSGALSLGARMAGEKYLGLAPKGDANAAKIAAALGNLKGPIMKIGQILSTIPNALPPEYAKALSQLQSNAPPMSAGFVRRRMRGELGENWRALFGEFDEKAAAAASLGQVHRATSFDGENLALKLQYPDMKSAVKTDLAQLKILFSLYGMYDKAIKTDAIRDELSARLYEELDYKREAKALSLYEFMLKDEDCVHVPKLKSTLSTDRLLTTTWLDGAHIMDFENAPDEVRTKIALSMFRAWYVPFYHYGVIHGDPHLGNYTVRADNSINLLDFGCIRIFQPKFVGGVIDLYRSLMTGDEDLAVHAYETWGFCDLTREYIDTLNIWAHFLYAPLMDDKTRTIGELSQGIYGRETAMKVHQKLQSLGGIKIPQEFVFMDRAALGLGSVFLRLRARVNWHQLFEGLISDFNLNALRMRQDSATYRFGL